MYKFDGNYDNLEQVTKFYPEFIAILTELEAQGIYPSNSRFEGKITDLQGDDEKTGIYLLQQLKTAKVRQSKIEQLLKDGYTKVRPEAGGHKKFASVVKIGNDMSRAGSNEYEGAKIWFADDGMYIVPKRNRTRGYIVWPGSEVYAK